MIAALAIDNQCLDNNIGCIKTVENENLFNNTSF